MWLGSTRPQQFGFMNVTPAWLLFFFSVLIVCVFAHQQHVKHKSNITSVAQKDGVRCSSRNKSISQVYDVLRNRQQHKLPPALTNTQTHKNHNCCTKPVCNKLYLQITHDATVIGRYLTCLINIEQISLLHHDKLLQVTVWNIKVVSVSRKLTDRPVRTAE